MADNISIGLSDLIKLYEVKKYDLIRSKTDESAVLFLEEIKKFFLFKINKILTDNGKEFTDRFRIKGENKPKCKAQI